MIDFLTSLQFQRKIHLIYYVPIQESLVAQKGRASQVLLLGQEDPLEKEMAIHSGTLAWKIPWTEEPGSHCPWGAKSQTQLSDFTHSIKCSSMDEKIKM